MTICLKALQTFQVLLCRMLTQQKLWVLSTMSYFLMTERLVVSCATLGCEVKTDEFLQVFNEVNSRKLKDELNIFAGLWRSTIFIYIILITIGLQVNFLAP